MPTLAVAKSFLFNLLGKTYTQEEFDDLCFEFGVELDEVTNQREIYRREHASQLLDPARKAEVEKALETISDEELYKIDTAANRYDLLCAEGMAISLRVFTGLMPFPRYRVLPPKHTLTVKPSVRGVRDFVVCAILRNITFSKESYQSFIDYQEKLHGGLARKRTLVSVGTHDLDKVNPDFTFECTPKEKVVFEPLNKAGQTLDCKGNGLEEFYAKDNHIGKYVPLISSLDAYPVIYDKNRTILSMPPIINSHFSRIEHSTTNVFIECTAKDLHRAHVFVNQMVSAFSLYCKDQFTVEGVKIDYEDATAFQAAMDFQANADRNVKNDYRGKDEPPLAAAAVCAAKGEVTPNLDLRTMEVSVQKINTRVGIDIDAERCASLLTRMLLDGKVVDQDTVRVGIPASRSDILHPCDLIEDVAIAFGYDNIARLPAPTKSLGSQQPMNKLAHLIRLETAAAGYTEMLTFSLCSRDEAFKNLRRKDEKTAVHIENPQTQEFQVCRPSLMPGTMKVFHHNKAAPLPLRFFEVSDIVVQDPRERTGCRNERHFAALHAQRDSSSFEDIQGLAEYVMTKLGVRKLQLGEDPKALADGRPAGSSVQGYQLRADDTDGAFFPGRQMKVVLWTVNVEGTGDARKVTAGSGDVGVLGVVHPEVLKSIDMPTPCSYVEINLEPMRNAGL